MKEVINNIHNIDCLNGLKMIEDNCIDLIITSPPYNLGVKYDIYNDKLDVNEYVEFISKVAEELFRVVKNDGRLCVNIPCDGKMDKDGQAIKQDISFLIKNVFYEKGFKYHNKIYWDKQNVKNRSAYGSWKSPSCPNILLPFEEIVILYKGERKKKGNKKNIDIARDEFIFSTYGHWKIKGQACSDHPATFPEQIPELLMKVFSYKEDIILDPFVGTGTTCVVAKKLERQYIGFELSENYCEIAKKRLDNE